MYFLIVILLIVLDCFFVGHFLLLCFPLGEVPLAFVVNAKAGLVVLNSLSFCLSVKLLISLSNLNEIRAG